MAEFDNIASLTHAAAVLDAALRDDGTGLSYEDWKKVKERFTPLVKAMRAAGEQPAAGTSAYEMIAAAEMAHVETTQTLLGMVAATVLAKLIDEGDCGRANIAFTPLDMDAMYKRYDLLIEQEGLETRVRIKPKPGAMSADGARELTGVTDPTPLPPAEAALADRPESLMRQDEPESPADEQAVAKKPERYYFFNDGVARVGPMTLQRAEQQARLNSSLTAHIENRACPLADCPSAGHATSCAWETCPNRK